MLEHHLRNEVPVLLPGAMPAYMKPPSCSRFSCVSRRSSRRSTTSSQITCRDPPAHPTPLKTSLHSSTPLKTLSVNESPLTVSSTLLPASERPPLTSPFEHTSGPGANPFFNVRHNHHLHIHNTCPPVTSPLLNATTNGSNHIVCNPSSPPTENIRRADELYFFCSPPADKKYPSRSAIRNKRIVQGSTASSAFPDNPVRKRQSAKRKNLVTKRDRRFQASTLWNATDSLALLDLSTGFMSLSPMVCADDDLTPTPTNDGFSRPAGTLKSKWQSARTRVNRKPLPLVVESKKGTTLVATPRFTPINSVHSAHAAGTNSAGLVSAVWIGHQLVPPSGTTQIMPRNSSKTISVPIPDHLFSSENQTPTELRQTNSVYIKKGCNESSDEPAGHSATVLAAEDMLDVGCAKVCRIPRAETSLFKPTTGISTLGDVEKSEGFQLQIGRNYLRQPNSTSQIAILKAYQMHIVQGPVGLSLPLCEFAIANRQLLHIHTSQELMDWLEKMLLASHVPEVSLLSSLTWMAHHDSPRLKNGELLRSNGNNIEQLILAEKDCRLINQHTKPSVFALADTCETERRLYVSLERYVSWKLGRLGKRVLSVIPGVRVCCEVFRRMTETIQQTTDWATLDVLYGV